MEKMIWIGLYAGLLLLIYIAGTRIEPYKPAWKLLERGLLGLGILLVWNLLATPFDLGIGVNPVTALVAGALGMPGLGLLLIIRMM
jgi:inhibitor of the pro-sigma K processing machinery